VLGAVVIGGGYTGVSAAVEIERRGGGPVLLLEATDRLGGRARSVAVPDTAGAYALDLGAHYFGRQHTRVRALVARLLPPGAMFDRLSLYGDDPAFRILAGGTWRTTSQKSSVFGIQGLPKRSPVAHISAILDSLCRFLALESRIDVERPWRTPNAKALDAVTAEQWIASQPVPPWIKDMWRLALIDIQSIYPEQVSLLYWLWYAASNGGFLHIANDFTGGPQEFAVDCGLGGLLERYAEEVRGEVMLDSPVVTIDHGTPDHVVVETAAGATHVAKHVVVAVTPGIASRISYTPELSPPRQLLHRQPVGHAIKAILHYEKPWWWDSNGVHHIGYSGGARRDGIEWVLDTSHPSGVQYSLTAFVSDVLIDRAGRDGGNRQAAVAAAMADVTADERAGHPVATELFDWREHPGVGGGPNTGFSPNVLTRVGGAFNQPEPPNHRLWFACSEYSPIYTGYVEGALAAGERVAAQVTDTALPAPAREPRPRRAALFDMARALLTPVAGTARWRAARHGWPDM
jgi:monoamine oxidase